jgi:hypothetical protein
VLTGGHSRPCRNYRLGGSTAASRPLDGPVFLTGLASPQMRARGRDCAGNQPLEARFLPTGNRPDVIGGRAPGNGAS